MPTKAWPLAALALLPFGPAPSAPGAGPGWGSHMMEVGYRFALAGRAAEAQNFPLADYEVDELGESFEQVRVVPPPEDIPKGVKLDGLIDAYLRQTLPPLRKAAQKADARAFRAAYASAVGQCNGCHKAAGKPFLKVPAVPQGATFLDLKP